MASLPITRPGPDETAPHYHGYIAETSDENIGLQLEAQIQEIDELFRKVTDAAALGRYAAGKWSIKEVLGHLADTERIFAYRLLRVARGDATPLAGYDENAYVPAGDFDRRPLPKLLADLRAVRLATIALSEGLPAEAWTNRGVANAKPVSARALIYIIVGHVTHHLRVLRERYTLGS